MIFYNDYNSFLIVKVYKNRGSFLCRVHRILNGFRVECLMQFCASGGCTRGLLIENPVGFQHGLSRSACLPLYFRFLFYRIQFRLLFYCFFG